MKYCNIKRDYSVSFLWPSQVSKHTLLSNDIFIWSWSCLTRAGNYLVALLGRVPGGHPPPPPFSSSPLPAYQWPKTFWAHLTKSQDLSQIWLVKINTGHSWDVHLGWFNCFIFLGKVANKNYKYVNLFLLKILNVRKTWREKKENY